MTGPVPKPAAEVDITEALVRSLLEAERPDLAGGPLTWVEDGWDNAVWRLGDDLCVRVTRRELAVPHVLCEQRWLPEVAPTLGLQVPVPIHVGGPTADFRWPWSVCRWIVGETLLEAPLQDQRSGGEDVAAFLTALHQPAPDDAPRNPYRGVPLAERDHIVRGQAAAIAELVDTIRLLDIWSDALAAPPAPGPLRWCHGDLHPRNVVVSDDRIRGIIDFGDLTAGDPAVDLSAAWVLLDAVGARALRARYHADDATWRRARGWAVNHGIACLATSADEPAMAAIGLATLARVLVSDRGWIRRPGSRPLRSGGRRLRW